MKAATISEIKRELSSANPEQLANLCLRLAKYKKENKELLTYLLFESHHEGTYVKSIKQDMDQLFSEVSHGNVYFVKKNLRKILRMVNRFVRYSEAASTELELRLYFCLMVKRTGIPVAKSQVLINMVEQQFKKIRTVLEEIPEDLRFDYHQELTEIGIPS